MHAVPLSLLCVLLLNPAQTAPNTQPRHPTSAKPKAAARPRAATARPATARKPNYDGNWTGTTGQGKALRFTVVAGKITEFAVEGRLEGYGCSTTSKVNSNLGAPISGAVAVGNVRSGPGGVSVTFHANFTSSARAEGPISLELHPIPGPPPGVPGHVPSCAARLDSAWTATKEGATSVELAPAAAAARTGPCRVPTTAGFKEEPAEEEQMPGTTRFYLAITGNTCFGPCAYLTAGAPADPVAGGLATLEYDRTLVGDMQGTNYRFGLSLRSNNPGRTSVESKDDPPAKLLAEIILRRDKKDTLLASTTFTTGPEEKRHLAVIAGMDPEAKDRDTLVVRTKWLEGSNTVYASSWVEVPETLIKESQVDLANATWTLIGRVVAREGRPQPGKRVMFSPLDGEGSPAKFYWGGPEGGKMPLRNPRRTTDADGRFKIRLSRDFFTRLGGRALAGEVVVVEDCEGSEPRRIGEPLRFTLKDELRVVDLGTLAMR